MRRSACPRSRRRPALVCTTRPSRRTVIVSASASTSPRKWETRITVRPPAARPRTISWNRSDLGRRERGGGLVEARSARRPGPGRAGSRPAAASPRAASRRPASAGTSNPVSATRRSNRSRSATPLDEAEPARLVAQEHVLGHGPLGHERQLLGHERDAALQRLARRPERDAARRAATARPGPAGRPRPRSCRAWTCRRRSRRRRRGRSRRRSRSRRRRAPWCRRTTCRPRWISRWTSRLGPWTRSVGPMVSPATPRASGTCRRCPA